MLTLSEDLVRTANLRVYRGTVTGTKYNSFVEVATGQPIGWEELGVILGAQPARYMTDNPLSKAANRKGEQGFVVHCQECGKACTKARGGEVLTRTVVVCGKCHDETKHGPCTSVTNHYR